MAKTSLNPVFEGFSRSIGNITFYRKNGKTFARRKSDPTDTKTPAQMAVRKGFTLAAEDWKSLPASIKKTWNKTGSGATGYNLFIGKNVKRYTEGDLPVLCTSGSMQAPASFSAAPGSAGSITVSYTLAPQSEAGMITIFFRPSASNDRNPAGYSTLAAPVQQSGSVSLDSCTAGSLYEIHAILSDGDILSASKVSVSAAVRAKAGI